MILDEETLEALGYARPRADVFDAEIPSRTFTRSAGEVDGRSLAHGDRRAKIRALYWARRARGATT